MYKSLVSNAASDGSDGASLTKTNKDSEENAPSKDTVGDIYVPPRKKEYKET